MTRSQSISILHTEESINAGGKVSVVLRYANNMNIIRKKYDLCSFVESANLSCPLEAGSITLNYSHTIPSSAPPVRINNFIMHGCFLVL